MGGLVKFQLSLPYILQWPSAVGTFQVHCYCCRKEIIASLKHTSCLHTFIGLKNVSLSNLNCKTLTSNCRIGNVHPNDCLLVSYICQHSSHLPQYTITNLDITVHTPVIPALGSQQDYTSVRPAGSTKTNSRKATQQNQLKYIN